MVWRSPSESSARLSAKASTEETSGPETQHLITRLVILQSIKAALGGARFLHREGPGTCLGQQEWLLRAVRVGYYVLPQGGCLMISGSFWRKQPILKKSYRNCELVAQSSTHTGYRWAAAGCSARRAPGVG